MSLTKKDPSLRVAASDPHLVSLGGGRLSTAVTIHYIHVGEYNLPRLQLTCAALQGQQQLQVALIKMSNKRDLTNVRENSKWNLNKKKLKLNLKLKRTEKAKQQTQFFGLLFVSLCCLCVLCRGVRMCVCVCLCDKIRAQCDPKKSYGNSQAFGDLELFHRRNAIIKIAIGLENMLCMRTKPHIISGLLFVLVCQPANITKHFQFILGLLKKDILQKEAKFKNKN